MKQKTMQSDIMMHAYARLLSMIARKLGHDYLLLRSGPEPCEKKYCNAVFGQYSNYNTVLLKANGKSISIKFINAEGHLRSNKDMYAELVELLYKILKNGGNVSDGKYKLNADEVSEFMINYMMKECL